MQDIIGVQQVRARRRPRNPFRRSASKRPAASEIQPPSRSRVVAWRRRPASLDPLKQESLAAFRGSRRPIDISGFLGAAALPLGSATLLAVLLAVGTMLYIHSGLPARFSLAALNPPSGAAAVGGAGSAAALSSGDVLFRKAMSAYALGRAGVDSGAPAEGGDPLPFSIADTFAMSEYEVRPGDTVSGIAARYGLSMSSVISLNDISNVKGLKAGSTLRIPNMDGVPYTVRRGDSLSSICAAWDVPMEAVLDANELESSVLQIGAVLFLPGAAMRENDLKRALGKLFLYPYRGRLTSTFGWRPDPFTGIRKFHGGIDLAGPVGSTVRAAMAGRVSMVGNNSLYGRFVIVSHDDGYQTWYAHLSRPTVERGQRVAQGEKVGELGNTGYSTGPHLHFAIYKNGKSLDPLKFLSR